MAEQAGKLIVLSGPSGAGKSTVIARLMQMRQDLCFSVSATTRQPRPGEKDGTDYFFVTREEFYRMVEEDALLEHAEYVGNCYGTPRGYVERKQAEGLNVLLDIDPQGARTVVDKEKDCVSVFILPPSYQKLRERLHTRNTEDPVEIERRLGNAKGEIEQVGRYQYAVVNDSLELAFEQLTAIVNAEKQRTIRYFPVVE